MKDEDKCLDCEYCYIDNLNYEVMCKLNKCEFKEEEEPWIGMKSVTNVVD